jgi:hypothetical protein
MTWLGWNSQGCFAEKLPWPVFVRSRERFSNFLFRLYWRDPYTLIPEIGQAFLRQ